jgi:VanZ family protein
MQSVARRWFALLVLGSASFTLFGSLVPFQFKSKPWSEAVDSFIWAMNHRMDLESRSDGVANVMLGVPLGFGLLGMLCADRCVPWLRASLYGLAMLPACCAFAASVEFSQLYVPVRTCSGSDVLAQTIGSAIGMIGWLIIGQRLTDEIRKATTGIGAAGRFLFGYVLLLGFIQALPLDLTLSPANVYRKFRDGGVRLIPFGEFRNLAGDQTWERIAGLLQLAGLYLPVGLLAGCLPGRFWSGNNFGQVALAALGLSASIEAAQLLVISRGSSATDALIGAAAVVVGWRLACAKAERRWRLGLVWFLSMAVVSWQPLTFPGPSQPFDWIPGMPFEGGNPLSALENMLTKLVLFGLIGAIVATSPAVKKKWALVVATATGLLASVLFEAVQTQTPSHSPSITDVLLGGFGSFAGAWVRGRVFVVSEETTR